VNGIRYPSASAAGVAIGVCGETIRQRLTNKVSGYRYASEVTEIQPEPTAAPPAAATASRVAKPYVRRRVIADGSGWFTVA
jgi:hypothetical protein